jgi:serine/threonine-protein kinase
MQPRSFGPYTIEERLATGGMAEVYVARRSGPHGFYKRVALKRILPQYARDPDFVAMFIDEATLAARLDHPNIVQVFDFGELGGELFLTMELVVGSNVSRVLRALTTRGQPLPLDLALHIVSQTAHALAYAHRARDDLGSPLNVVHRDVSPANILLSHAGYVKLSDFGIARMAGAEPRTDDGQVRGKLGYMSPEQVTGRPLDGRSDVFTLAAVFAEMLIGTPLFGTSGNDLDVLLKIRDGDLEGLDATQRKLPPDIVELVKLGLVVDKNQRPNAVSFAAAIDDAIRRRGMVRGPDRLARLLGRFNLVRGAANDTRGGDEPTSFVDMGSIDTSDANRELSGLELSAPPLYRVRLASDLLGPISYPKLVQLVTSGTVTADTEISKLDGDFIRADALPELVRFVTSPALSWKPEDLEPATRRGTLDGAQLLSVIHHITARRDTGALHLLDGERRKKIYFVDGRPDYIASNDENELFGQFLVKHRLCLRMEVDMALALLSRYGGRLGDALVGLGVLRPVELFRAIAMQVRQRYLEAYRWRTGRWAFVPEARAEEETVPLGHDVCELMRDGALEAPSDELAMALDPFRDRRVRRNPEAPLPLLSFNVPEPWHRLLDVRGDVKVSTLVDRYELSGGTREDGRRAIYLGLSCEILQAA